MDKIVDVDITNVKNELKNVMEIHHNILADLGKKLRKLENN